ncbi:hypothetical protein QBC45DRAFT_401183 [Copromyces sp. CBS 386.78]|nr:hypothetical protein QBC45DRAFT_401183 [Copromyces sp. CBS 386.78]
MAPLIPMVQVLASLVWNIFFTHACLVSSFLLSFSYHYSRVIPFIQQGHISGAIWTLLGSGEPTYQTFSPVYF